jgi:hypothetical protein
MQKILETRGLIRYLWISPRRLIQGGGLIQGNTVYIIDVIKWWFCFAFLHGAGVIHEGSWEGASMCLLPEDWDANMLACTPTHITVVMLVTKAPRTKGWNHNNSCYRPNIVCACLYVRDIRWLSACHWFVVCMLAASCSCRLPLAACMLTSSVPLPQGHALLLLLFPHDFWYMRNLGNSKINNAKNVFP